MIKQPAKIIDQTEQFYVLETLPKSACPKCDAGEGCGGGLLAKAFSTKTYQLKIDISSLKSSTVLTIGQSVQVGIPSQLLVRASMIVYMIPLLSMVMMSAAFGVQTQNQDAFTLVGALVGFILGLLIARFFSTRLYRSGINSSILLEDEQQGCWYQAK